MHSFLAWNGALLERLRLVLAYLLFQKIRGKSIYRVLFFMPYITSTVASAAV